MIGPIESMIAGFTLATIFFAAMAAKCEKKERTGFIALFMMFFGVSAIMWLIYTGNGWWLEAALTFQVGGHYVPIAMIVAVISIIAIMFGLVAGVSPLEIVHVIIKGDSPEKEPPNNACCKIRPPQQESNQGKRKHITG